MSNDSMKTESGTPAVDPERRAYSVREVAKMLGVHRATIYRVIDDSKLATLLIGGRRLVPAASIDALLAGASFVPPRSGSPAARRRRRGGGAWRGQEEPWPPSPSPQVKPPPRR
jgi:excisionase family DNA binding protein